MGDKPWYDRRNKLKLTESQSKRIHGESQHGDWYAKVDPKTGAITWLRRKVKKRKK